MKMGEYEFRIQNIFDTNTENVHRGRSDKNGYFVIVLCVSAIILNTVCGAVSRGIDPEHYSTGTDKLVWMRPVMSCGFS